MSVTIETKSTEQSAAQSCELTFRRCSLSDEETAALTAVLEAAAVAARQAADQSDTSAAPDRTQHRRRQLGLWARPGADSWKHAAGPR